MNKNVLLLLLLLFIKAGSYAQISGIPTCWECVGCNENSKLTYDQNTHNEIAIGNDGTVFVAYTDSENKPHVKKYNGVGWDIVGGIISGFAERVSLALDPSGKPYIFYQEWGTRMGVVKRFTGSHWELVGPYRFTSPMSLTYPSIDISSTGEVFITYESYADPEANSIYVKKFDGANWVDVGEEFTTNNARPSVKIDGADNVYLVSISSGIKVEKLINNSWTSVGATGASMQTAYPSPDVAPDLSFDNNDVPYIGYSDGANQYKATVKKFDGANWVVEGTAGFSPDYSAHVKVAFDSNNSPYVTFMDSYAPSYEGDRSSGGITVMKLNGGSWELVGNRFIVSQMSIFTGIVIDKSINKPYVVFLYRPLSNDSFDRTKVYSFNGTAWQWLEGESSGGHTGVQGITTDNAGVPYISRQSEVLMYDGSQWQSIPANNGISTNIIFDNANNLYRYYHANGTSYPNYTVILDKYTGSGWIETGRLTSLKSYSIELDPAGVPYLLHTDASNKMTLSKSDGSGGWSTEKTFSGLLGGTFRFDNESNITIACLKSSNNRLKLYKIYAADGHIDSIENASVNAVSSYTMAVDKVSGTAYIGTITSPNGVSHFSAIRYNGTAKQDLPILSSGGDNGYSNPHFSIDKNGILYLFAKYPGNETGNSVAVFRLLSSWHSLGSYVSIPPASSSGMAISQVSETIYILLQSESNYFVKKLALAPPPAILDQPIDTTICSGVGHQLQLKCSSLDDVDYLWQVDKRDGFGFITMGDPESPYSGTRDTVLRYLQPPASLNNYRYRCVLLSGNCQSAAVTDYATITVNETPTSITILGSKSFTCIGDPIKFYISNANGTNVTFQWRVKKGVSPVENLSNDATYAGVNTDTLTILNPVSSMHGYEYTCQLSNMCKTIVTNSPKTLYLYAPDVTTEPVDKYVCGTSATSFTLTATGSGLSYRWQLDQGSGFNNLSNGAPYSGTTTATLSLSSVSAGMNNYKYRCIVTNSTCPADTSVTATLHTNPGLSITSQPTNTFVCAGATASLSVGTSEGGSTTYSWRENSGSGFVSLSNGSLYSGQGTSTLTITNPSAALNGRQYQCIIIRCGSIVVTSATAVLTVGSSTPAFLVQPVSKTACEGLATNFSVTANGGVNYKWQLNTGSGFADLNEGGMYSGTTTATLSLSNPNSSMSGYLYRCEISNSCSIPITSNNATLSVIPNTAPVITSEPSFNAFCAYGTAIINVEASGTGLTYTWQVNTGSGFTTITSGDFNYGDINTAGLSVYNVMPSYSGYQYRCIVGNACGLTVTSSVAVMAVAESFISFHTSPANVTSCPGATATFSVGANGGALIYQWQVDAGSGFTNLSEAAPYSGTSSSQLTITNVTEALTGYKYRCVADNSCASPVNSSFGTFTVTSGSVSITSHPVNKAVCAFLSSNFSVAISGTASSYQWQVNDGSGFTNLSNSSTYAGTSSSTLVIINTNPAFNGYEYRCIIDPSCGGITSNAASLTVHSVPTVTANVSPSNLICTGTEITLTGNGASSYTWNHGVTDGVPFTPVSTQTYTVTGTNANNCTDTDNIQVTVGGCTEIDVWEQVQTITVTPNPSSGNFNISFPEDISGMQLEIYDSKGVHVCTKTILSGSETIDLNGYPGGIYQVWITQNERVIYNERIVKQ